ncbi:hypothetical protein FVEN_g10665 [Fusarium venenatum]|nr:hypothetical protein FVEN_g10665 [Fusarium venenatum]
MVVNILGLVQVFIGNALLDDTAGVYRGTQTGLIRQEIDEQKSPGIPRTFSPFPSSSQNPRMLESQHFE